VSRANTSDVLNGPTACNTHDLRPLSIRVVKSSVAQLKVKVCLHRHIRTYRLGIDTRCASSPTSAAIEVGHRTKSALQINGQPLSS
jgi:hypothetical protein